jgi:DNA-binding transcriptional MerR regulator
MAHQVNIGELAKAAGVPVSTIRFYERQGILQPSSRSESGYRQYSEAELERLRFVKLARNLGFTLDDAVGLLEIRAGRQPAAQSRELIRQRLEQVEEQIAQLQELQCLMRAALNDADCCAAEQCEGSHCAPEKCELVGEFVEKLA